VVVKTNSAVQGITDHELRYDASQGGTTFMDPDGDPLTYTVAVPSRGLAATGPLIVYTPNRPEALRATIVASDGRGGEATDGFDIFVDPNSPPQVVKPNGAILTSIGSHVNYDLTQAGTTFVDKDGDPLVYTVKAISPPGRGIDVIGT